MQEIVKRLGLGTDVEPSHFSSPLESFEHALDLARRKNFSRIDIVTWSLDNGDIHMYLPFVGVTENSSQFSPEQVEDQLLDFFHAHYASESMVESVRSHQFVTDAVHGEAQGLFSRSVFWEIPIGGNLVLGEVQEVDRSGIVQSRSYFIGKPAEERNLRPGQKLHRFISQNLFTS